VICPCCSKEFNGKYPATSRLDNKTPICSECGELENRFVERATYSKEELKAIAWHLMHLVPEQKFKESLNTAALMPSNVS
jgi:hypothetical protein